MIHNARSLTHSCAVVALLFSACADDRSEPDPPHNTNPGPAELAVERADADFGAVAVGAVGDVTRVVITNSGGRASTLAAAIKGPDAASFAIAARCDGVAAGRSCVLAVTFAPSHIGPHSATLELTGVNGTLSVALSGEGIAPAALTIAGTADFGSHIIGERVAVALTVTNSGAVATGRPIVRSRGRDVTVSDTCSGPLAPAATCTIEVVWTPTRAGSLALDVQVVATPGGVANYTLEGVARTPAALVVAPTRLFGAVAIGSTGTSTVSITNGGDSVSGPVVTAVEDGPFSASGCNGATLAPGATCDVTLTFAPTALGASTAELTIGATPGGQHTARLAGSGVITQLTISPASATFAAVGVGEVGAPTRFTITNVGPHDSGLVDLALSGEGFALTGTCAALAPGAKCAIDVASAPGERGFTAAELVVQSSGNGEARAGLNGQGLAPAALTLTAPEPFGALPVGVAATRTFELANDGDQRSAPLAIAIVGDAAFALESSRCPARLAPQRACRIAVRFTPSAIAAATATLEVRADTTSSVPLAGVGVDPQQLVVAAAPSFTATTVGQRSLATLTLHNPSAAQTGAINIVKTGSYGADFTIIDQDCGALAPAASCTISLAFEPRAPGTRTAQLALRAAPGGVLAVDLVGLGRAQLAIVGDGASLAAHDFGAVFVDTTLPAEADLVVVNNAASARTLTLTPSFGSPAQMSIAGTTCTGSLAAGAECTITVRFHPTRLGAIAGTLVLATGPSAFERVTWQLAGRGIDALVIDGEPDLGAVSTNTAPAARTFTVMNPPGATTSGPLGVSVSGAGFALALDECSTRSLAAGDSCNLLVAFSTTHLGPATGSIFVRATPGGALSLALAAVGAPPTGSPPTQVTLTPATVAEDAAIGTTIGTLATVDADAGDTFSYSLVSGPGFALVADAIVSTQAFDFESATSRPLRVRVIDSGGNIFEQDLAVAITNVDEPTVALPDAFTIGEDAATTMLDVLANDSDPDTALVISAVTQPALGVVAIAGNALTYTPKANACAVAPDTFSYFVNGISAIVAVALTCIDDPGVAVADATGAIEGGSAKAVDVLANDTDIDGNLRIASVSQPLEGTVVITGGGSGLTYQPAAYPTKTRDDFSYTLVGGAIGTVAVTITITSSACQRPSAATACVHGSCSDGGTLTLTCACVAQWQGAACDVDVNECETGDNDCADDACNNLPGGFRCECPRGFVGDGKTCDDIDECDDNPCGGLEKCTNTTGGYTCDCSPGFERVTLAVTVDPDGEDDGRPLPTACVNVDECATGTSGCTGAGVGCIDSVGAFDCTYTGCFGTCRSVRCDSYDDYVCTEVGHVCSDVDNPQNGVCVCQPGYEGGPGGGCWDIDECERGLLTAEAGATGALCVNTEGGAYIECADGTVAEGDGLPCDDIDECEEGFVTCAANERCVNGYGSATCECEPGFKSDGVSCVDIDECADSPCDAQATCSNGPGDFACTCRAGWVGDGLTCFRPAATAAACDPAATFIATAPSHCACGPGYVGDGLRCGIDFSSDGRDGVFAPTTDVVLQARIYRFTTINIPQGVVVYASDRGVLDLRASGDVIINGMIDVRGETIRTGGRPTSTGFPGPRAGNSGSGAAGTRGSYYQCGKLMCATEGGRFGGGAGATATHWNELKEGGGGGGYGGGGAAVLYTPTTPRVSEAGAGGGPDGGTPSLGGGGLRAPGGNGDFGLISATGTYGYAAGGGSIGTDAENDLAVRTTFRPGSGGGGGSVIAVPNHGSEWQAFSGGGGGGAVRIVSATRIFIGATGNIDARGGGWNRAWTMPTRTLIAAGGGSGGVIYLGAPDLVVYGVLLLRGGNGMQTTFVASGVNLPLNGGDGGNGRLRLSARKPCQLSQGFTDIQYVVRGCTEIDANPFVNVPYWAEWPY